MSEYMLKSDIKADIAHLKEIDPDLYGAWMDFHNSVFKDGALTKKEKELIAVAGAHITRCSYCIRSRVNISKKHGASDQEITEAIYVGMRFAMGAPYAYSSMAYEAWDALENDVPLTEGHFFKKNIAHEIKCFSDASGEIDGKFKEFTKKVFADGALTKNFKRGLLGLACAQMTRCPYCIRGCVKDARAADFSKEQIAEAINVSVVMAAGACYAHSSVAMDTLSKINSEVEKQIIKHSKKEVI
ncbi:carboxymuconolactone decarboxylase family protein [Desulfobacterota bacterium AH_259_B03_O07]|nr:carboxymuconolactone decarboxylase family protein [Desulfobacterota bacterium AH_259_B03_O07]